MTKSNFRQIIVINFGQRDRSFHTCRWSSREVLRNRHGLWTVDPADAELSGVVLSGGVDWQLRRADGTLDIEAHYVIRASDGALIEVNSRGYRHGPAEVMTRLAKGEAVSPGEYYFRTAMTFQAGTNRWAHLNSLLAIGKGRRETDAAVLDVCLVG